MHFSWSAEFTCPSLFWFDIVFILSSFVRYVLTWASMLCLGGALDLHCTLQFSVYNCKEWIIRCCFFLVPLFLSLIALPTFYLLSTSSRLLARIWTTTEIPPSTYPLLVERICELGEARAKLWKKKKKGEKSRGCHKKGRERAKDAIRKPKPVIVLCSILLQATPIGTQLTISSPAMVTHFDQLFLTMLSHLLIQLVENC